jgi:hypothetical protein
LGHGDGVANIVEYATGLDPNDASESSALNIASSLTHPGELEVTFPRIVDPALTYTLQGTKDLLPNNWLTTWTGGGTANDLVVIPESMWPSNQPRYFFRLVVSHE